MPARRETIEEATARMVPNPDTWPHMVLPLKQWVGQELKLAILTCSLERPYRFVIYRGACMGIPDPTILGAPVTPEQVIAEGWVVD